MVSKGNRKGMGTFKNPASLQVSWFSEGAETVRYPNESFNLKTRGYWSPKG
jgi:hypothetical protein